MLCALMLPGWQKNLNFYPGIYILFEAKKAGRNCNFGSLFIFDLLRYAPCPMRYVFKGQKEG
jgi:hypothetical protein